MYSCFRGLIAYLGSQLILYYEITFSNFEVLNFYLVKVCRTFSICSLYTQVEVTVPLPFLLVAFMICFYINSIIYLEFSVWRELGPGFLVFWTAEHFLSSICPVVHLGPLIKVLFWIHFQFLLYFSCSFNSVQPDPSLSVSLECRHWPFIESIHVFSNFIHTMQTETTCLLCDSKSVHKYPHAPCPGGFFSSRFLGYVIFSWFHVSNSRDL